MDAKFILTLNDEKLSFLEKKEIEGLGKATLISLKLKKEIYIPAHIEAVLQIEVNGNISSLGKMSYKSLLGKTVSLSDGEKELAKDYIIFDYIPEYKPSENGTSLYLTLNIYSPEKVLGYQKYNKCYVAKKLGADIFTEIAAKHSKEIRKTNIDNLQHIFIKNKDNTTTEFIQPYLVQYEETALDFLTRSANRCGEFMFYENGVWQLGFKPADAIKVEHFASLTFNDFNESEEENYYTTNYLKSDSEQETLNAEKATRSYNGPKPEYLDVLVEGESSFKEALAESYNYEDPSFYINNMCEWMKKSNATEIISSTIFDLGKNVIDAAIKNNETEASWTESFITPYMANKEQSSEVDGKKVVSQFSNYNACDFFQEYFYTDIKKLETAVDTQAIHINFGTYYQPLLLGDVINVLGSEYVIVRISTACKQNTSLQSAGQYSILEIDAVPKVNDVYYPPIVKSQVSKAVTQTAIVSANNDPCNLGRIQIRYPWQPESSPTSPWIRVSQAFASKDAGIMFLPQVGDEIIVGYEFGEMERPFMLGALASTDRKMSIGENKTAFLESAVAEDTQHSFFTNDFLIKSLNGQYIKFIAPDNDSHFNLTSTFFPAVGAWLSYLPTVCDKLTYAFNTGRQFSGGIKISDAYGFFKVQMSTESRNITISSPLGDVNMDALTGITISAPNGNVKIEGKNVDIIAGNNLTLKSGENVQKMTKAYNKNFGQALKANLVNDVVDEAASLLKPFDLKLLRTVIDAFLKPIGGTMLIKSARFMRLEAGKGETKLPHTAYKKGSKTQKNVINSMVTEFKIEDTLSSASKLLDTWRNFYETESQNLDACKNEYESNINWLATEMDLYQKETKTHCKISGKEFQETGLDLQTELENEIATAEDIVKMAESSTAKAAESHEKLDKLTYTNDSTYGSLAMAHQALKDSAEKLFDTAKLNQNQTVDKDRAIDSCLTHSDLNFIASVGDVDEYKSDIKDILSSVFDTILTEMRKNEAPDVSKRKVLYQVLQKLQDKKYISIENEAGLLNALTSDHIRNTVTLDESACNDSETWQKFLDCVKTYEEKESMLMTAGKFLLDNALDEMATGWKENNIYHPENNGGEILFSDTDGNTRNIKGDFITKTPVSPLNKAIDEIKKI